MTKKQKVIRNEKRKSEKRGRCLEALEKGLVCLSSPPVYVPELRFFDYIEEQ